MRHIRTANKRGLAGLLITASLCTSAYAQEVAEIPFISASPGSAALGGGIRTGQSPYFDNENEDVRDSDLIPLYLYNGKWLFARGTSGGIHLYNQRDLEFNLYTRYRFQKLDPDRNEFYEGLEERKQTLEAGVEVRLKKKWGEMNVSWLQDILGRHDGMQLQASYRYDFNTGPWTFSPFISYTWQDEKLTNYYFGVSAEEARPDRPEYTAGSNQYFSVGLNTAWHITDRIALFGNIGFSGADDEVLNSPLVEGEGSSQIFVGGTYLFGNAISPDYIIDPERKGEWSWRVNYGYQADGNIVSEIDQGDFSKSEFADTNIAGLTLAKLLHDGPRVDFLGKLALFRHLEEDEGNGNFFSYAAYIMAMGHGYSPWSGNEVFRWGFAFGMSYAETVPIAEQRKQESRGNNTSQFLNYLEMQLDFPLRRVSKAKWLQNCYAGITLVHRSGIFGSSDLLGDVAGGSDWITAHLECIR